jgi:hypothetical protein
LEEIRGEPSGLFRNQNTFYVQAQSRARENLWQVQVPTITTKCKKEGKQKTGIRNGNYVPNLFLCTFLLVANRCSISPADLGGKRSS